MSSNFRASGLASGIDTQALIDSMVKLESRSLDALRARQQGLRAKVSVLGDMAAKLGALKSAADALGAASGGVLGVKSTSSPTGFSAAPSSASVAGRYSVQVTALAQAAKARSVAFTSATAPVTGGTLELSINGTSYSVSVADGAALSDVALSINQSGAPVSASVLSDGTSSYLSITNRDTGHAVGSAPGTALSITETSTGVLGQALGASIVTNAANAHVSVDGLSFERTSNEVTDVIPGTALSLTATGAAQDLVLSYDGKATATNLQKFVDAYNDVMKLVQKQAAVTEFSNRSSTLAGDGAVRSLQSSMQSLISAQVPGLNSVRSLADLGVKSNRDGTLALDSTVLDKAIARDPSAVNKVFNQATTGLTAQVSELVDNYTNAQDGILTSRKSGLNSNIRRMDDQVAQMELRLQKFQERLIAQFTAMEKVVGEIRAVGGFLDQQALQSTRKS